MKVFNLLRNLWQRAKSYSNSNLQTAKDYSYSLRALDYENAVKLFTTNQTSQWRYTATKDGVVILNFFATTRAYLTSTINGVDHWHFTPMFVVNNTSIPMASVIEVEINKGDVFVLSGLNSTCYLGLTSNFVPYKIGGGTN